MREIINTFTISAGPRFVKRTGTCPQLGICAERKNRYNKGSLSAEVAELADA